ncbi:hypothetical protein FF1_012795 [Malus domestica]
MKWLTCRPSRDVMSYSSYIINGNCFHTRDLDRSTQDSGVSLKANTLCRSSANYTSQAIGKVTYYGVINDIILRDYHMFKVPIFDCDWANITNASQAKKVFYWRLCDELNWYDVLDAPVRGFYNFDNFDESDCTLPLDVTRLDMHLSDNTRQSSNFIIQEENSNPPPDIPSILDNEGSKDNNSPSIEEAFTEKNKGKSKQRGKFLVDFNRRGQPFGENAAKYASLLGVTAKELVLITKDTWKEFADDFKHQLWEHV